MYLNKEPIKNWFGFNRRERRATFVLLFIIVVILAVRYLFPFSLISIEDISGSIPPEERSAVFSVKDSSDKVKAVPYVLSKGTKFKKPYNTSKPVPQKILNLDLNTADSMTFVRLPGIGPVLSARIIKYRRLLGGFARVEQLKEVYGLPAETYEMIKGRVYADSLQISRININSAAYKEIIRLPYLEKYEVTAILKYRELKDRINNIGDLIDNKLLTIEKARKVNPYLKYDN
jgi:DNA uptake protein ComE-like DNA-binding protein